MTVPGVIASPGPNVICVCLDADPAKGVFLTRQGQGGDFLSPLALAFFLGCPAWALPCRLAGNWRILLYLWWSLLCSLDDLIVKRAGTLCLSIFVGFDFWTCPAHLCATT